METVRALAPASVLVAVLLDAVLLPHLLLVGAVQPLGGSARMLLVRAVVPPRQLTAALTQEEVRSHATAPDGRPLGGLLYATAVALGREGTSSTMIGLTLTGLAFGGLAGTALVGPPHRALAPGALMLCLGGSAVLFIAALALPFGPWWIVTALFLLDLFGSGLLLGFLSAPVAILTLAGLLAAALTTAVRDRGILAARRPEETP